MPRHVGDIVASRVLHLARAKVHWGKLDGVKLVKDGPPPGKALITNL